MTKIILLELKKLVEIITIRTETTDSIHSILHRYASYLRQNGSGECVQQNHITVKIDRELMVLAASSPWKGGSYLLVHPRKIEPNARYSGDQLIKLSHGEIGPNRYGETRHILKD